MGLRFAWWWTRVGWMLAALVVAFLILVFSSTPAG
jgi:hypothetical protein